ncbi:MAG: metallophosphoesterase [Vulcanibacillus sp.]
MKKLITVGDLHSREKEPYYSQWLEFMHWLFDSEYNCSDNGLLLLGDLVESISVQHELLEIYVDFFNNKSKFEKIIILTGNHDRTLESSLLSIFRPLQKVEVIDKWKIDRIENLNCLFVPHIENNLIETYSALEIKEPIDYCFHHIEDDTSHFSKKFVDTSKWNVKNYLCGHIHTETVTKKGHFLGSPTFNSLNEKGKTPYIAVVDCESKKYELVKVPIWVDYLDVYYPNELPLSDKKYAIYTVYDSIDKEQSIKYYTKQAQEKGFNFYCRRVHGKAIKNEKLVEGSDINISEKTILDYFTEYKTINNVDDNVSNICINVLQTIEEK